MPGLRPPAFKAPPVDQSPSTSMGESISYQAPGIFAEPSLNCRSYFNPLFQCNSFERRVNFGMSLAALRELHKGQERASFHPYLHLLVPPRLKLTVPVHHPQVLLPSLLPRAARYPLPERSKRLSSSGLCLLSRIRWLEVGYVDVGAVGLGIGTQVSLLSQFLESAAERDLRFVGTGHFHNQSSMSYLHLSFP
jgi:hypothetical protein